MVRWMHALLLDAAMMNRTAVAELLLTSGSLDNSNHYKPADNPLHFAALHDNIDIVKMLLNKGANINAKNQYGKTPLFNAIDMVDNGCKQDKLEVIQLLLKHKADVNASDNDGTSLLHIAVKRKCLKIVEYLFEHGVNVNCVMFAAKWNKNYAPLHYAVEYDLKEVATLLLSRGANVDIKEKGGITPLHIAAEKGYTHITEELLSHGASINSLTLEEEFTLLHIAAEQGYEEIVKLFLNRGADVNATTKTNLTPLHVAMKKRDIAIVNLLLKHGADYKDKDGKTILQHAVEAGCLMIIENILRYCPNINNQCNRSSLKVAVLGNTKEIVHILLEYGLNVNPEDTNDAELLHAAVRKGYLKIVEDLLKYGADVNKLYNTTFEEGFTPIHSAAKYKQDVIAKLLISYEADINAQDKSGKTPIFYAIENADLKMTELLLTNKATIKDNPELLNLAVMKECIEIVEALLKHDADINYSDKYGRTALHFTTLIEDEDFIDEESDTNINTKLVLKILGKSKHSFTSESSLQHVFNVNASGTGTGTSCSSSFDFPSHQDPDIKGKIAELLLSKGANVNAQTKDGQTTLNIAIKNEYVKVVEALLKYNANLNSSVKNDVLPLHLSAQIGNEEIIRMLLNKGADVNAKQTNGMTALHIAVEEDNEKAVKILLDSGADVNSRDDFGRTALHIASAYGHASVFISLLATGSDINVVCRNNRTPLEYANSGIHTLLNSESQHGGLFGVISRILTYNYSYDIIKMKAANLYVNDKNLTAIKAYSSTEKNYQDVCEKEIAKMKSENINKASISYYDILRKSTTSLAAYVRNPDIVQVLESDDYESKFPHYASMLKNHFKKAMDRKELLKQGNQIFYFLFNNVPMIPDDCTEKILSYLSDKDLKNLMTAANAHSS